MRRHKVRYKDNLAFVDIQFEEDLNCKSMCMSSGSILELSDPARAFTVSLCRSHRDYPEAVCQGLYRIDYTKDIYTAEIDLNRPETFDEALDAYKYFIEASNIYFEERYLEFVKKNEERKIREEILEKNKEALNELLMERFS